MARTVRRIVLIQPAYPYGSPQIYLPGSLLSLGARLMQVGFVADLIDLNRTDLLNLPVRMKLVGSDFIGITVLGTPYIPEVRDIVARLRAEGHNQTILIGGEGIVRIKAEQFAQIFHGLDDVQQVCSDEDLHRTLGLTLVRLPTKFETSMVSMLRLLDEQALRDYLRREFCLFISHGCVYNCNFCAAAKDERETYRDLDRLLEEVEFVAAFLAKIGHPTMMVYLSNLDALQTWSKLDETLRRVHEVAARHRIQLRSRALATTHFTALALRRDPNILQRLQGYGLRMLGFGVDGVTEEVWRRQNKRHNSMIEFDACVAACKAAGIESEALMVIGLPGETLAETVAAFVWSLRKAYGDRIAVRAYLGKDGAPGSKRWLEDPVWVQQFLDDPSLFLNVEYTMFASSATHPDLFGRYRANLAYALLLLSLLPSAYTTPPLLPIPRNRFAHRVVCWVNERMPLDR